MMKKRWTLRIFVFLLLGAIVNVAVTWGIAALVDIAPFDASKHMNSAESTRLIRTRFGQEAVDRSESIKGCGVHNLCRSAYMISAVRGDRARSLSIWEYGIPMNAMRFELQGPWRRFDPVVQVGTIHMPEVLSRLTSAFPAHFPTLPIWPGFAINTVFYAVILWVLFALGGTPFALRRRWRVKRGLCPKCGYDLRGGGSESSACPECGGATR